MSTGQQPPFDIASRPKKKSEINCALNSCCCAKRNVLRTCTTQSERGKWSLSVKRCRWKKKTQVKNERETTTTTTLFVFSVHTLNSVAQIKELTQSDEAYRKDVWKKTTTTNRSRRKTRFDFSITFCLVRFLYNSTYTSLLLPPLLYTPLSSNRMSIWRW